MAGKNDKNNGHCKDNTGGLTYYIGIQNEPLGQEPNVSMTFGISLRVFTIAFTLSRLEKMKDKKDAARRKKSDAFDICDIFADEDFDP